MSIGQDLHDPGGKVKFSLGDGVQGDAVFSDCGRYRRRLRRWTGPRFPQRRMLFIGMNPSTADAMADDPTVSREWRHTLRNGFHGYVKCNIGDYRATSPKDLLQPGVVACSDENIDMIAEEAFEADMVVCCWGKVNKALVPAAKGIAWVLQRNRIPLWCFGTNSDGSPKHPLYLRSDTELVPFLRGLS